MSLFGKRFKKQKLDSPAADGIKAAERQAAGDSAENGLSIKVLGGGCAKCDALEAAVKAALNELSLTAEIEHVKDFAQIAAFGVMATPALVLNGKVAASGRVLKTDEVKELISRMHG